MSIMKPMPPVSVDLKSLEYQVGYDDPLTSTEFFDHETKNKPVTQCGNTDPIHSYNHPQNILHTVRISHM